MILGFHSIFSAYGFWLPNDPRGSWSDFVAAWELFRFGKATKTDTTRSVAHMPHNRAFREQAKQALKYPPVVFDGHQALSIASGFADAIAESGYVLHACAILPEHVHLVVARSDRDIRRIIGHFKGRATQRLKADGRHPFKSLSPLPAEFPSPWAEDAWHVYLDSTEDMIRAIAYVDENPLKEGKHRQNWPFVTPYVSI